MFQLQLVAHLFSGFGVGKNGENIPAYKSASGQRTFLYRATSFWNSLPCEIRGCDNLPIFKRHLKEFLSSF